MFKRLVLVFGLYSLTLCSERKNHLQNDDLVRFQREAGNAPLADNAGKNDTFHIHIHNGQNITSSDRYIARDESVYFVSALFKKYNNSVQLSLDGFVRMLCGLGLIPEFEEADDTKLDCREITFDRVPPTYQSLVKGDGEETDGDQHSNHDHDHEGKVNLTEAAFSGDGNASNHDNDDDHHNHLDEPGDEHSHHDHDHHEHDNHDHDHHEHDNHDHDHHEHDHHHDEEGDHNSDHKHDENEKHSDSDRLSKRALSENRVANPDRPEHQGKTTHVHSTHIKECASPRELLDFFHIPLHALDIQQFTLLCPALLYKLDSGHCRHFHSHHHHDHDHSSGYDHAHDHDHSSGHDHDHDHDHDHHQEGETAVEKSALSTMSAKVWGYSTAAVLVISLAGLLGVAVIPIMQKVFYNHLLQFLVAIAVGALSGDALLHLLPHAISKNQAHRHGSEDGHNHGGGEGGGGDSHEDDHLEAVWKGLVALTCIFFFFLVERILTIVTEKKRRKKNMSRLKNKHCKRLCDAEEGSKVGAKLSAHQEGDYADCEQMVMVVHPNRALKGYADATHDVMMHQCDESLSQAEPNLDDDDNDNSHAPLGQHNHAHAHAHGHSHVGSMPGSVAAVAWMVIFGDGIHNFSDGLAIGVAFANSITGGISTSVAVFCHELPHEIGDFAVLLRAGMSVKQAIVYNCVSSVLCFVGMLAGVAMGNIHNASQWIFAGVGGMFIYISMVDMLPEMTAVDTKKGENHFLHLFLQVCGMMIGAGIMLIIAVFEHDLQMILD